MVTKVKSGVIGDNTVGITQLNVSDGSDGQALTTNGAGTLSFASVGVSGISSSADATAITIDSSERVSIGHTTANADFQVSNAGAEQLEFFAGNASNVNTIQNYNRSTSNYVDAKYIANNHIFQSGGTEVFRTSGSNFSFNPGTGNLGSKYLFINAGTSNDGGFILRRDNTNQWQITNSTTDGDLWFYSYGTSSTVLAIDRSTGNLGVGTTSPAGKFQVEGSHSGQIGYFNQTGTGGGNHGVYIDSASTSGWTFLARNGGTARFGITGTEARIFNGVTFQSGTSTSNLGGHIRTWAGSGYIGLTGDLTGYSAGSYSTLKASGSYIYFDISGNYSAYMSSNGALNANSDRRLKENITTLSSGQLAKICALRGVNYTWIDERATGTQVGLIAQEIQEEYPELVDNGGITDGTLTVNYAGLVSPLIEAIKELKTELDAAKARITTLEG